MMVLPAQTAAVEVGSATLMAAVETSVVHDVLDLYLCVLLCRDRVVVLPLAG